MNPGISAACGAALCWAGCSLFFTAAGKRVGSVPVSLIRLAMGLAFMVVFMLVVTGRPLPAATGHAWFWLGVSGLVGFLIGDICLFESFLWVGPRVSMLIMTIAPLVAAALSWVWLGEALTARAMIGIAMVIAGVAWVIFERRVDDTGKAHRHPVGGVVLAVIGAVAQGVGLVFSKVGMEVMSDSGQAVRQLTEIGNNAFVYGVAAAMLRALIAFAGYLVLYPLLGWGGRTLKALRHGSGMAHTAAGAFIGPFLGVGFSMVAILTVSPGIAATIMQTSPIIVIPFVAIVHKDRITLKALIATLLAVAGVAVLAVFGG